MPYIAPRTTTSSSSQPAAEPTTGLTPPSDPNHTVEDVMTPKAEQFPSREELVASIDGLDIKDGQKNSKPPAEAEAEASDSKIPLSPSLRSTPSLPGLADSKSTSASEISLVSLNDSSPSISPTVTTSSTPLGLDSPSTALTSESEDEGDDRVKRYRQTLYAYTKELYLQAKLSEKRKQGQAGFYDSKFGLKQSGMEKMAAKKALAKRLNG